MAKEQQEWHSRQMVPDFGVYREPTLLRNPLTVWRLRKARKTWAKVCPTETESQE